MIVPEGHRIVVEIPESEDTYKDSPIYKTAQVQKDEKYSDYMGRIVAIGPTAGNCFKDGDPKAVGLKAGIGDTIAFTKYAGVVVTDPADQKEYRIINDEDVMAVIK